MSQFFILAAASSEPVTSITGVAPIEANGVSGVAQTGAVSISIADTATSYTNVTNAMSPYTVLPTDFFISVDSSGGPVTINFNFHPDANQEFVIKDRTGDADTNTITITSSVGDTFDLSPSYTFIDNYESVDFLFHGSNFESF